MYEQLDPLMAASEKLWLFTRETVQALENEFQVGLVKNIDLAQLEDRDFTCVTVPTRTFYSTYETIIREGQRNGEFRTDLKAEQTASFIVLYTRGLRCSWALYRSKQERGCAKKISRKYA
jgi:hypothetical protein